MSTSLAEQLQRLAVPQTTNLVRDKKKASFLFEPKVAAGLSKEAVYELGFEGFEELLNRNAIFAPFQNSIFHVSSKEFERSVHDQEENSKLNETIKRFLLLLSPYFLTHGAHASLEWLIHRFHIHQYNTEDFLLLILPYHETNYFVRALQIIKFKNNNTWSWLKPLQKAGIHLPKQTLYNHASSDPFLIQIISNYVLYAIKEHDKPSHLSIIFSFYGTVFVGALKNTKSINEAMLSQMLPCVLKGLSSVHQEFAAPSYIIVSKLIQTNQFSAKLLDLFVLKLSSNTISLMHKEQLLLLVLIFQTQSNYKSFPDDAIRNLANRGFVGQHLEYFTEFGCVVQPFLAALFGAAVKIALDEVDEYACRNFVDDLLKKLQFDDGFVPMLLEVIFENYRLEKKYSEETMLWMKNVIKKIEQQKPAAFDDAIRALSKSGEPSKRETLKRFHKIVQNIDVLNRVEIFEKLHHPLREIRDSVIAFMIDKYSTLKEPEQQYIQQSLVDCLNTGDGDTVKRILRVDGEILIKIIERDELITILINFIEKTLNESKSDLKLLRIAVKLITEITIDNDMRVFFAVLPFLLTDAQSGGNIKKLIISSTLMETNFLLKSIKTKISSETSCNELFEIISNQDFDFKSTLQMFMEKTVSEQSGVHQFLRLIIMCQATKNISNDLRLLVLCIIETQLENNGTKYIKVEPTFTNYLLHAKGGGKGSLQGYLLCLETLISKMQIPEIIDFYETNIDNEFYLKLLLLLLKGCHDEDKHISKAYWKVLNNFFEHFCSNNKVEEFLLNVLITQTVFINKKARRLIIQTLLLILKKKKIFDEELLNLNCLFVPYLLVSLQSTEKYVRTMIYDVIGTISGSTNYAILIQHLLKNQSEICLDNAQLIVMINKLFKQAETRIIFNSLLKLLENRKISICLKAGIVKAFNFINDLEIYTKLSIFGSNVLQNYSHPNSEQSSIIQLIITQFSEEISKKVSRTDPVWDFLQLTTKDDKSEIICDDLSNSCPSILIINQIDSGFFKNFKPDVQTSFLDTIITVVANTTNPEVTSVASKFFKHIDLDANSILPQLIAMRDAQSSKIDGTKRKRRSITVPLPTPDILDELIWKKGVVVLELLQDKKKIRNVEKIMSTLFEVLKKCLDFDEQSNVEYPKQLILSSILHCCDKIENATKLSETVFNMELVVQCIRASQNPQTHHHALLLLARATEFTPTQVLMHIMAIFTFIGSSVLRHDDAYSFQIIAKIIDTVIPILVKDGDSESVLKVLRVFVDVILDVPEHRRIPLYRQLLEQIGTNKNLHIFMLLVFEAQVLHTNSEKGENSQRRADILTKLCHEFDSHILINSCTKLLEYVRALPDNKEDCKNSDFIFDIKRNTPKQFRHYKYMIILFISKLLQSKEFVNKIAALNDEQTLSLEGPFNSTLIHILTYIRSTSKIAEHNSNSPQGQYWKVVLHHSYDILDGLNALLTPQMFLLVIKGLMTHSLATVRRRAIELLNAKIQHNAEFFETLDNSELYAMIPPLMKIIQGVEDEEITDDCVVIIQTAFFSLKLFVKLLANEDPEKFVTILNFVTERIYMNKYENSNILASAILCSAELSHKLHAHAIPYLSKFMYSLIKILKRQKSQEAPNLLLMSALTSIQKIFDSLSLFLSPFLLKLLCELANLTSNWVLDETDPKIAPFITKLANIKQKIGTSIPPRILIPTIDGSYNQLIEKHKYTSISALMDVLCEHLKHFPILEHITELTIFFLGALQFRSQTNTTIDVINIVEADIIKALLCLTLKLSESTFRPLYYKLYDWAIRNNDQSERIITFYALSAGISKSLKGLFVLFAGHIINNVSTLLDATNKTKTDQLYFSEEKNNLLLLENVLETLNNIFLCDGQKFINKDRFDVLMQPIVDQLDNTLGDGFEKRVKSLVIPCVVNFAVATGDDALWKQMNYQVLLKMRDSNATIRLLGLECLTEVAKKLGEDFLPLLPETIPFLAELLEDEEELVEKACQKAVQELEKVLGEPLQKYF